MGLFNKWLKEELEIEQDIAGYAPKDREKILWERYGRTKNEFNWMNFGDKDSNDAASQDIIDSSDLPSFDKIIPDSYDMSIDMLQDLDDAGIDTLDFDLMDNDERLEVLEEHGIDTDFWDFD